MVDNGDELLHDTRSQAYNNLSSFNDQFGFCIVVERDCFFFGLVPASYIDSADDSWDGLMAKVGLNRRKRRDCKKMVDKAEKMERMNMDSSAIAQTEIENWMVVGRIENLNCFQDWLDILNTLLIRKNKILERWRLKFVNFAKGVEWMYS